MDIYADLESLARFVFGHFHQEWAVITEAPVIFFSTVGLCALASWLLMRHQLANKDVSIDALRERLGLSEAKFIDLAQRVNSSPDTPMDQLATSASRKIDALNAQIAAQQEQIAELSSQWRGITSDQYIKFSQAYPHVVGYANFTNKTFTLPVSIEYPGQNIEAQHYAQQLFALFGFCAITTSIDEANDSETLNSVGLALVMDDPMNPTQQDVWVSKLLAAANVTFEVKPSGRELKPLPLVRLRVGGKPPYRFKIIDS
jgi:hypothetical protein